MATVALLGIPVVNKFVDSDALIRMQSYESGATNQPRKDLECLLAESAPGIKVVDLGEPKLPTSEADYGLLSIETARLIHSAKADAALVIGGNHGAAFPIYHLPGHVVRADAHGDAYVLASSLSSHWKLNGATYMYFVAKQKLKEAGEVWNVGVEYFGTQSFNGGVFGKLLPIGQILRSQNLPKTAFVDIDVDVLKEDYRLPHGHSTSNLAVKDLAQLVTKLQPNVVGLFECVNWIGAIPQNIISAYPNVFGPICKAVAELAVARAAAAKNGINPQTPQVSSATYR